MSFMLRMLNNAAHAQKSDWFVYFLVAAKMPLPYLVARGGFGALCAYSSIFGLLASTIWSVLVRFG